MSLVDIANEVRNSKRRELAAAGRRLSKDRRRARASKAEDTQCAHWCGNNYYGPKQPSPEALAYYTAANGWEPEYDENEHGDLEIVGWRRELDLPYASAPELSRQASPVGVDQI